ncbi:MAG: hypothetical protein H0X66_19060 [Verrucomicrobia bacterium]|nr:hypothetical protein [Verrucomicrobiota bacterium]
MNRVIKLGLYAVLIVAAIYFGHNFFSRFNAMSGTRAATTQPAEDVELVALPIADTNIPATNTVEGEATTETNTADLIATNNVVAETSISTDVITAPRAPVRTAEEAETTGAIMASAGRGKMWGSLGAFLGVMVVLGLLAAYDVTQFLGNRTVDFLFNEDLKGVHDPDYEQAEQIYANGKPLEAIQMLREYLRKNPKQQHAALRIAEIYEKDLGNFLAAALEYEEILKHKLPRERWGWAAIHLCNLYSKLGKSDQTVPLLRRIAEEYSETAAAKKARKRLAMYESAGDAEALGVDMPEDPNMPDIPPPRATPKTKEDAAPPSNLPPGFRPKK